MIILCRLAPYERRVIELLRNSKDKRARKLAKKRVHLPSPIYIYTLSNQTTAWYLRTRQGEGRGAHQRHRRVEKSWSLSVSPSFSQIIPSRAPHTASLLSTHFSRDSPHGEYGWRMDGWFGVCMNECEGFADTARISRGIC